MATRPWQWQANPDVMLIDEVLSVGDSGFAQKSAEALRERLRAGKTVILVSHDAIRSATCAAGRCGSRTV